MDPLGFVDWGALRYGDVLQAFVGIFVVSFILVNFLAVYAGVCTLLERKIAGHMQSRVGPYRVGPHGALQWLADALKLMIKEDIIAKDTDRFLFRLAPYVVFGGAFACWVALPFAPGWSPAAMNIGILYILALSSAVVIGILMAGWSSGSKWALFGAMRSAAQIVSYEVPVGLTLVGMLFIYGTLDMQAIAAQQEKGFLFGLFPDVHGGLWSWGVNRHPPFTIIAFLIYYTAALAETNRTPFDIPEAESELVAGYHTEYSGMRFSFFFLAEYANMFVVSAIATTFFLGGWLPPFPGFGSSLTAAGGGLLGAAIGYGIRKRGWDASVGFLLGSGLGVLAGVYLLRESFGFVTVQAGWTGLRFLEGLFWFFTKCFFLIFVMIWLRWTLPRYRVDQLMDLCWKKLTPLAFVNLLAIGTIETARQWWPALRSLLKGEV
jgi:NADH-quinone oxidoreductase subunit H